jgi:hypothetical protein
MKTTLGEPIRVEIAKTKRSFVPEFLTYTGSLLALGAMGLWLYGSWEDLTKSQKTATFSILAISFFIGGLLASDTIDIRRRASGYLYSLSAVSSGVAVYVTYDNEPAPLQSFALATVIALLGYTVASTQIGHAILFLSALGTLVALGYQFVSTESLQLYTQLSLVIAFALSWLILSAFGTINTHLGYALATGAIFSAAQFAFFKGYESLAYSISFGLIVISIWLYLKIPSWVLVVAAAATFATGISEWVIGTMDNSNGALLGMLLIGAAITVSSLAIASSTKRD